MMTDIKVFNLWSTEGLEVQDVGLKNYISLKASYVPKTGGKNVGTRFHKSKTFIVERLMNKMMGPGHKGKKHKTSSGGVTGKGATTYGIVRDAFKLVEQQTKKNPIEVFVRAVENAAPREEVIMIEYGGAKYSKAVECAPQRRLDLALRMMTQGAFTKSFNGKTSATKALAEEILNAYAMSTKSQAVAKKHELERQADASR
ncbi:30S ribosomal protein S7 [Candidatus Woesearchaeota archaeon]|nr:30S ribosomal protein S7 [Candidatus Woesearchaeota archaeon]